LRKPLEGKETLVQKPKSVSLAKKLLQKGKTTSEGERKRPSLSKRKKEG